MSSKKLIQIAISQDNYLILKKLGSTGDSFNDVLTLILQKIELLQSSQLGYRDKIVTNAMNQPTKEEHNCG